MIAGSDTVGNALTQLHYHLLVNPEKLARLKQEVQDFKKSATSAPKWQDLKQLPYLTACIDEILRLANTVTHRLARVAPKEGLRYKQYYLPAGTSVSMSTYLTHMDPELFPSPDDFIPERWLSPEGKALSKFVNPFSKGPRICLGIEYVTPSYSSNIDIGMLMQLQAGVCGALPCNCDHSWTIRYPALRDYERRCQGCA